MKTSANIVVKGQSNKIYSGTNRLMNITGEAVQQYKYNYNSMGDICRTYSTTDTTVNKFTGKERYTETGDDYFGARYYDSKIGR